MKVFARAGAGAVIHLRYGRRLQWSANGLPKEIYHTIAYPFPAHLEAQSVGGVVRARDFEERVHVSNGGDEVGHEAPQGRVEVHLMGLVAPDVLEQILDLRRHVEVRVVGGVVRPGE